MQPDRLPADADADADIGWVAEFAAALDARPDANDRSGGGLWALAAGAGFNDMALRVCRRAGGWSVIAAVGVLEELGRRCRDNGAVLSLNAHVWSCLSALDRFGSTRRKAQLVAGVLDGGVVLAHAATEPDTGSDLLGMRTEAARDGAGWRITGHKTLVSNAPVADAFLVLARTSAGRSPLGLTGFVIDRSAPGVTVSEPFETMGLPSCSLASVSFDGCRAGADDVLGAVGGGYGVFSSNITWERGATAAVLVGTVAKHRWMAGRLAAATDRGAGPLTGSPRIADRLVDTFVDAAAARGLVRAWAEEQARRDAPVEASTAKLFTTRALHRSADLLFDLGGGRSYLNGSPSGDELRDALASRFYGGTDHALRHTISAALRSGRP